MRCDDGLFEGLEFTVPDKPTPLFIYPVIRVDATVLYREVSRENALVMCEGP